MTGETERTVDSEAESLGEQPREAVPPTREREQIHLYALCWNDAKIIPYFFRHYNDIVDRFFVYDNGSTDGSLEQLTGDERVRVVHWDVRGDSLLDEARILTNSFWKQSRGSARWVFVVDLHEHLFHSNLRAHLAACARNGVTAIRAIGYDMVAERLPTEDKPLWQLVTRGVRFQDLDKLAIFDPDAVLETNYQVGRHASQPTGNVVWEKRHPVTLLNYARMGVEYTCERNEALRSRLRPRDIAEKYGFHYAATRAEVIAQHTVMLRMAVPVPALAASASSGPERTLAEEMQLLRHSGLFQQPWYVGVYPDVSHSGMDPLEHFCLFGWREGRKPNPHFDPEWYTHSYGEIIGDVNPLLDYVLAGEGLGRKPARDFDPMEYRFQHGLASSESPLRHCLAHEQAAAEAERLPTDFDPMLYLKANPDVAEAGLDPAWHFINLGKAEGRQLRPVEA